MTTANPVAADARPHHKAARLNRIIQWTLISGLIVSLALMTIGALLYLAHPGTDLATRLSFGAIFSGLATLRPQSFMLLGIIILMLTPAMRVVTAALGYLLERDYLFAAVSTGVIVVLLISLMVGAS
ncbi:MAG: DUF1634 domain-containing protein [Mycobacterium leprae]